MSTRPTPSGISFLSFIYIVVGMIGLISIVSLSETLNSEVIISIVTLFMLIVSSIALYLGKKWGWWIVAFTTLFAIINKVSYVYIGLVNLDSVPDVGKYFLAHAGKMIIQTLIFIYLFQKNVNDFFKFNNSDKIKRFGIILILNLILYAIFFFL